MQEGSTLTGVSGQLSNSRSQVVALLADEIQVFSPSTGPYAQNSFHLAYVLRNKLKYALTGSEIKNICMQRFVKTGGKVGPKLLYPAGFMDVLSIEKTGKHFCLVYDTRDLARSLVHSWRGQVAIHTFYLLTCLDETVSSIATSALKETDCKRFLQQT
ncbi:PREDICTED: 40S ribosomal protein S4, Y-like [Gavialis gangeticus]|uniref:40S ribosomal protein S4, Y-like n=1 Tax=Gavialis gangeticus TaxID=94835 RepID=UPI00092EDE13|nr:PREDICTED: 40S ribosomal protein S4, Y-like [Gavialis gangeticus]